ncbi:MAG: RNA polymerase Rpb4 family protein [Halobacteriota archaeon]|nr:RNA polymerase Rpb4 family protein [Halobacteriota archaeon]
MMLIKEVISEESITLAEAKDILNSIKDKHVSDEDMAYGKRKAIAHANKFAKTDGKSARALVKKLVKLDKMKPEIAIKISDLMPKTRDELRSVYAKERFTLTDEELDKILDLVSDYSK